MYPFWKAVIEPALVAAQAQRVVEIGALRGETTVHLLELLGPQAELHVIDPVPIFDPSRHEQRFPGRYVFHRDISHNVLPGLESCDAALVDGDHNWFTVLNELRMLRDTARAAGRPLPLLILHDVCWPYGRRDLYYDPERIPDEHRQPYDRQGLMPGRTELVSGHGLNQHLANAVQEGGPRNGVRTGLDDFLEEHDRAFRCVILPVYYGLALVADQDRLDASPELGEFLSRLESADFRYELMQLAEGIRVTEQVGHHDQHYAISHRARRVERLYLDLLKGALLDEHHIENELRIEYLLECIQEGAAVSPQKLGDPGRYMSEELRQLRAVRRSGELPSAPQGQNGRVDGLTFTDIGRVRLDQLERCLDALTEEEVQGDLVECGTGAGGAAVFMRGYLEAHDRSVPNLWIADRFGGGTSAALEDPPRFPPDLNAVREAFARFDLYDERVRLLQGPPAETLRDAPIDQVALLRVDRHDPDEVRAILEALYAKVALGGFVLIDDYGAPECQEAVEAFRAERGVREPVERTDWSGALWRKTSEGSASLSSPGTESAPATARKDLSVVVIFHNMRREAARTLHSLSRNYQQGIDALDYEVVVVENGSTADERLGEDFVRSFGNEFRYIDLGEDAHPSPAQAVNRGLAESRSSAVALMIDGAHVLSPGVLQLGMLGLTTYGPAVVTTQQWYVGPGQQNEAVARGYDRDYEDALFEQIRWPTDGYRLFDISHFIGGRDWFDDQWESNCIFASRPMVERAGRLDESFAAPGGGFVNLDFFERMASSPGVTLVSILGEGSFHQLHGGTTTNLGGDDERTGLIADYGRQYAELRGRRFRTPSKEVHYVGSLPERARRTRPRRMRAPAFKLTHTRGTDGRPERPVPVPEDLRLDFIDAFWKSEEWQQTTWLGKWIGKAPTDLLAYQDLAYRLRPRWIVETGTGGGGRAFYLASVCDLIGTGKVLSIDDYPVETLMEHPRITYLRGNPADPAIAAEAHALVGEPANALLILGLAGIDDLMATFRAYEQLVPVGSYVVVEDTIVNGHPVWTGFGPGPFEAARRIVSQVGGFAPDTSYERYGLTFNPGGFLKRVAR